MIDEQNIELLRKHNVKSYKADMSSWAVEFFAPTPEPMDLSIKNLAKTLTDSMPPDSAMLFAATENPTPTPPGNPEMA